MFERGLDGRSGEIRPERFTGSTGFICTRLKDLDLKMGERWKKLKRQLRGQL